MLVSHNYRFIFIKTVKTAGTSVEAFLEPYCCPPEHQVNHWTPTLMSEYGIVGARWPDGNIDNHGFYNHMSAAEIRDRLPEYDSYLRITCVRNPYDRAISYFHFSHPTFTPPGGIPLDTAVQLVKAGRLDELKSCFVHFLRQGLPDEEALLCINGVCQIQRFIRFESLIPDLEALVNELCLPLPRSVSEQLPTFKLNRQRRIDIPSIEDYLSPEAYDLIEEQCSWSFNALGYQHRQHHEIV